MKINNNNLKNIWGLVPFDYYEKGVQSNLLQKFWHNQKIKIFKELVKEMEFKRILDVGCNSGRMANEIAKIFPKTTVYGVDVHTAAIRFGKKKYSNLKLFVADAHRLPFKINSFDLVVCYETIEHVVKPLVVLQKIKRVLKKGGVTIIAMDSGNWLFRIVWFFWENTKGKVWKNAHLHPFKPFELEQIIKMAGLKIIKNKFSHLGMEVSFLCQKI